MTDAIKPNTDPGELSPFQRDLARTEQGRSEIEATRAEAARRRQNGEPPLNLGERPDAGNALDPAKMAAGQSITIAGKDGKAFTLSGDDVAGLMERHALETQRKATMPADASGYLAELPKDFAANGAEVRIDPNDPALTDLRNWAHQAGLSQDQFSNLLAIEGGRIARENARITAARNAEAAKLGANAGQRIDAVATWWKSMTGDDGNALGQILRMAPTAGTVTALERIMSKFATQGHAPFSQAGREPADRGRIDGYDKMSFEQRRFAQDQRRGRF